jgi:hypothetical protein
MNPLDSRRAFLFLWDRRCYVVLVDNGRVVERELSRLGRWRVDLPDPFLRVWLEDHAHYDPFLKAWWVGTALVRELMEKLDGGGSFALFKSEPWPHNDPTVTANPPGLLDTILRLLSAVSPSRREKLAKAIAVAAHPDGDDKYRPPAADALAYLSGDVLKFVRSNADQDTLWTLLLLHGLSLPTPATPPVAANSRNAPVASPVTEAEQQTGTDAKARRTECWNCGRKFVPTRSDARYCSPACRQAAYRRR